MLAERSFGVTAAICTHNGATRIGAVLEQLGRQRVPQGLDWEVVIIDNASTDGTVEEASRKWQQVGHPARLRIAKESKLGLAHARERGLKEAAFDVITLIDDDNVVCREWIATCADVMRSYPSTGAVGGRSRLPAFTWAPDWFEKIAYLYAVGDFGPEPTDVTTSRPLLWGAGLTLRTSAWENLYKLGFRPMLSDRRGANLVSGGDSELCLALRRAGWRLRYEPRLQFEHVMSPARFEWNYFRRLARGSGRATPFLDGFYPAVQVKSGPRRWLHRWWIHQAFLALLSGLKYGPAFIWPGGFLREGHSAAARVEPLRGRLAELLVLRGKYGRRLQELDLCRWESSNAPAGESS